VKELFELIYQSSALNTFSDEQLESLVSEARNFNVAHDITGLLVFDGKSFLQILEGDKKIVEDLYDRISMDERHCNVNLRWSQHSAERSFSDWSMGCFALEGASVEKDLMLKSRFENSLSDTLSHGSRLFSILSNQLYSACRPVLT
jgi:hypothetical protein